MPQVVVQIAADADDGTEFNNSSWVVSGSEDIGWAGQFVNGGFRFIGVTIPAGATIVSAKLTVKEISFNAGGSLTVTIAAWKTNNPPVFDSTNRPSVVTKTTATASWTFNSSTNLGTTFDSSDFANVISELYAAYGFNNSSIAIAVIGGGSGNDAILEDFAGVPADSARLTIVYSLPPAFPIGSKTRPRAFAPGLGR